jgi:pyruvate/2-oxoglutarate dehydrogenase complex dihydrolipoamide acyltransferase (E2) component
MINIVGKNTVPTYLFCDIDMSWVESLRLKMKDNGERVTVTAFLLKAIGIAQRSHPHSRTAVLPWGRIVTFNEIVAGFTVERFVGCQPAVFFGAITSPDTKSVQDIADELRAHTECEFEEVPQLFVQDKFSKMPWLIRRLIIWLGLSYPAFRLRHMGATFGLSSLGKFGLRAMIPPCVTTSTFGVGTVEERPIVKEGKIEIRPMMTLTLNFDHRAIDGAPAARFLQDVCALMEGGLQAHLQEEALKVSSSYS